MENIIALLRDAKQDIERARNTENPEAHQCFLDCAAIYIDGAIQIANSHIKHETRIALLGGSNEAPQ